MGEEQLLKALTTEAEAECAHILSEAKDKGAKFLTSASTDAALVMEREILKEKEALSNEAHAWLTDARLQSLAELLKVKSDLIEEVFSGALERINALDKDSYELYFTRLKDELEDAWPEGVEHRAYVSPGDKGLLNDKGAEVDEEMKDGIVFKSPDNRYLFENTSCSRLERSREELIIRVNNLLFDEE